MKDLHKSLGGGVGTFLALSTILGSGMMILPGTSYHTLARSAWMPWAVAALAVVPLLYCYAWLGRATRPRPAWRTTPKSPSTRRWRGRPGPPRRSP
ncbi:hypothetical protein LUR56_16635 [Streptomyces sp. MT29]|nr:hypothetical protein [Streptomyces sp. MT29]